MGQLELYNVPLKGWIINPCIHGPLYGPCNFVCLPTGYGEVIHTDVMTRDVAMGIYGGRGPKVFLEPFPKGPCRLPYALLITIQFATLIPVDYLTFLCDVLTIGGHHEVLDGVASFKMDLASHLTTNIFVAFA